MPPTAPKPDRQVLDGVPKIGYHRHLCPFPGSLFAVMEYLGEPCDYDYLMGVTGAAFRRFWDRDDGGNVDLMYLSPEPCLRAETAIGRELRPIAPKDKSRLSRAIRSSINKGRPVLAFGIIGPPECGVITGYDEAGQVAIGYSYFQDPQLPGYYEKRNWFEGAHWAGELAILLIGEPKAPPSRRDVLVSSLKWAVDLARKSRRPEQPGHLSGLAAYEGWAAGLEVDADYPTHDPKILGTRTMVHGDQCVMLEERRSAAAYLRSMLGVIPKADEHLTAAAALYDEAANQGGKVWLWGHDMSPAVGLALTAPETRRSIAQAIRWAALKETQAVEHLEAILRAVRRR